MDGKQKDDRKFKNLPGYIITPVAAGLGIWISLSAGRQQGCTQNCGAEELKYAVSYAVLIIVFLFGLAIAIRMLTGDIDLSEIIDEMDGGASVSRFQLLIFTFVIGLGFLYLTISRSDGEFPHVPEQVLLLLGISTATYGVSKGLQISSGQTTPDSPPPIVGGNAPADSPQSIVGGNAPAGSPQPIVGGNVPAGSPPAIDGGNVPVVSPQPIDGGNAPAGSSAPVDSDTTTIPPLGG